MQGRHKAQGTGAVELSYLPLYLTDDVLESPGRGEEGGEYKKVDTTVSKPPELVPTSIHSAS